MQMENGFTSRPNQPDAPAITTMQLKFLPLIACAIFSSGSRSELLFTPALISNDLDVLAQIPFPKHEEDFEIYLRCSGYVRPGSDQFFRHGCSPDGDELLPFLSGTSRLFSRELKVIPASVDGQPVTVFLKYTVRFRKVGIKREIALFQNHGYLTGNSALDYIGAQRIVPKFQRVRCHTCSAWGLVASSVVDQRGTVRDIVFVAEDLSASCSKSLARNIHGKRYIPATIKGKPVDSLLVDTFYGSGSSCWVR